jgi:hypothetical protein
MGLVLLEVGAKVKVLGGPFAGRVGVISELDGKGGARVTLGLMSARVLLEDLSSDDAEGAGGRLRARSVMQSSHRHPEPPATGDVRSGPTRSKKNRLTRRPPSK